QWPETIGAAEQWPETIGAAEQWPETIGAAERRVAERGLRLVIPADDGLMASLGEVLGALYIAPQAPSAQDVRGLLAEALRADLFLAPEQRALWPRLDNPAERWYRSLFPQDTSGFGDPHRIQITELMQWEPLEAEPAIEIAVEVAVQNFPWNRAVLHGYGPDNLHWDEPEVVQGLSPVLVRFHTGGGFWAAAVPDADGLLAAWEQPGITAEDHDALRSFGPGLTSAEEVDAVWSLSDVWTAAPAPAGPGPDGTGLPSGWEPDADTMDVDDPHPLDDEAQVPSASGPVPSGSAPVRRHRPAARRPAGLEEFMSAADEYVKTQSLNKIMQKDKVNVRGRGVQLGRWLLQLEDRTTNLPNEEAMLKLLAMGWSPNGDDAFNDYITELEKLRDAKERGDQDDRKDRRRALVRFIALQRSQTGKAQGATAMTIEEFIALEAQANAVLARMRRMIDEEGVKITSIAKAFSMQFVSLKKLLFEGKQISIEFMRTLVDPDSDAKLRQLESPPVSVEHESRRPPVTIKQKILAQENLARLRDLRAAGVPAVKMLTGMKMTISTLERYLRRTDMEMTTKALRKFSDPELSVWLDTLEAPTGDAAMGEAVAEGSGRPPSQSGEGNSADTAGGAVGG
ncbi:hypothetical protein, partial [Streptomyces sp. NPDC086010]|uniref:hypothetical protein n=1 Tax=Streptomyces sp. NPDC086010 TaxID=3365745 RepID=UPI0037D1C916